VALRCGLQSTAVMRRAFMRRLGVSPAHYREKFRSNEPMLE
jgi:transcriptional regulator GlxA family with amidase domain